MKLFETGYEAIERAGKDMDTQSYLKLWTEYHQGLWQWGKDYVEDIRQAQQKASLLAIKEVLS